MVPDNILQQQQKILDLPLHVYGGKIEIFWSA